MKKTYIFYIIGVVLFIIGCISSIFNAIQIITSYKIQIWNIILLSLFSFLQLAFIVFLFHVLKGMKNDSCKKKNIVISIIFSFIIATLIFSSYTLTSIPNYLILSELGLIDIWVSIWLQPATLTLIGSVIIMITNIILLFKKHRVSAE